MNIGYTALQENSLTAYALQKPPTHLVHDLLL
jgi:hypothetical protein